MSRSLLRLFAPVPIFLMAAAVARPQSLPQETGSILGTVADSAGARITGAQVTIAGIRGRAETGTDGSFRMGGVPAGAQLLIARRIGFRPESLVVTVRQGVVADVSVRMRATPQQMAPMIVQAGHARPIGRLRGFNERRLQGIGHFFTAADIERRKPLVVTDLLRSLPGVRINPVNGQKVVIFREQHCTPLVWVDGAPAAAGYLDVDLFTPSSLAGIEVYSGPSTIPSELQWMLGKSACGVIALWTQVPEGGRRAQGRSVTAQDLANLIATTKLFTADQVDVAAAPDTASPIAPLYPDSLLRSGVAGRTIVEFVVDTAGAPDMDTFGVVASTDELFSDAVRRAVSTARFSPAFHAGVRVRQLVQLPVTFTIPAREPSGAATPPRSGSRTITRGAAQTHHRLRR